MLIRWWVDMPYLADSFMGISVGHPMVIFEGRGAYMPLDRSYRIGVYIGRFTGALQRLLANARRRIHGMRHHHNYLLRRNMKRKRISVGGSLWCSDGRVDMARTVRSEMLNRARQQRQEAARRARGELVRFRRSIMYRIMAVLNTGYEFTKPVYTMIHSAAPAA